MNTGNWIVGGIIIAIAAFVGGGLLERDVLHDCNPKETAKEESHEKFGCTSFRVVDESRRLMACKFCDFVQLHDGPECARFWNFFIDDKCNDHTCVTAKLYMESVKELFKGK